MVTIVECIRRRGALVHSMTNIYQFMLRVEIDVMSNCPVIEKTVFEVEVRKEQLTKMSEEFESIQTLIETLCADEEREAQYAKRIEFTDQLYSAKSTARYLLSQLKQPTNMNNVVNVEPPIDHQVVQTQNASIQGSAVSNNVAPQLQDSSASNNVAPQQQDSSGSNNVAPQQIVAPSHNPPPTGQLSNNHLNVKLPTINLPVFDSDINTWLEFKDTFRSLIHDNPSIADVMKFHYLRACLTGESQKIIQSIETSAANYEVAWDLLCSRYDNSKLLIQNHLKALFSMEEIQRESSHALRALSQTVFKHLRALALLDEPTTSWDSIMLYLMASKLDKISAREWENCRVALDHPQLSDMQDFLRSRADFLENYEANHAKREVISKNTRTWALLLPNSSSACYFCNKADHFIYKCEDFLKLSVPMRIEKAKNLKLCLN